MLNFWGVSIYQNISTGVCILNTFYMRMVIQKSGPSQITIAWITSKSEDFWDDSSATFEKNTLEF